MIEYWENEEYNWGTEIFSQRQRISPKTTDRMGDK